jgi:hypothetical protein
MARDYIVRAELVSLLLTAAADATDKAKEDAFYLAARDLEVGVPVLDSEDDGVDSEEDEDDEAFMLAVERGEDDYYEEDGEEVEPYDYDQDDDFNYDYEGGRDR